MKNIDTYKIGVDVGSTTLKIVVLNDRDEIVFKTYRRHQADFNKIFIEELNDIRQQFSGEFSFGVTGSAGMGISERTGIPFVQEVVSSVEVVQKLFPAANAMIDIGGEDAKLVLFADGTKPDIRMNGNCAGGTGAFIDQMADLMDISVDDMGRQALEYEKLYPMASRCGVFAKTDVQNMIARNLPTPDVAMSILHSVALQCVTSLARGAEIKPVIVCIGGPLTFIPALCNAFRDIFEVADNGIVVPDNSQYFPALGAAIHDYGCDNSHPIDEIISKLSGKKREETGDTLPALFADEPAYESWLSTRNIVPLRRRATKSGEVVECFLGIDSGSTTTKILIIDTQGRVVYNFYSPNEGNSLKKAIDGLSAFIEKANSDNVSFRFLSSAATGYGEELIKSALNLDYGIVETMAHLSGAQYVDPQVSFVLDIGGQDMKSIFTQNGAISNIELNEACSSGCGSFLQNFASTMDISISKFTRLACLARHPRDLGTRCTVFMNSKVKQSLRENASLGDISAGLAYSVVKNCLFKVLKISNLNLLGDNIVVQGGTFRNDAVYRALELVSGKQVSSTDCPELMGALGAALYAQKMWLRNGEKTGFSGSERLPDTATIDTRELQCGGCTNKCSVLRFRFENGNTCYAGNKCEKIFYNKSNAPEKGFNAFDKKNELLFRQENRPSGDSNRIKIGIPRVLNMFENYPFWQKLFTECSFEVVPSDESTYDLYRKGVGSVMSDNICFPAKLAHGHIHSLVEKGVDRIFYPIVPKDRKEFDSTSNSFNCPVVSGYPDVIRSSINPEESYGIPLDKPVITLHDDNATRNASLQYFTKLGVDKKVFEQAFTKALEARDQFVAELRDEQKRLLDEAVADGKMLFVVAGRPYHTDPLIHQKTGQILADLGVTVLTDDVFRVPHSETFKNLKLVSQWSYPNRAVQAAIEVAKLPQNIQYVQLNSFGCGPDSFFMDEISEVLKESGKNYTVLRIDEIASPGSIRLRLRSLVESLKAMKGEPVKHEFDYVGYGRGYTKADKPKTILIPWLANFVSPLVPAIGELAGYKIVNLPKSDKASADVGLKYGNNEVCYPSTLVLGDIIAALQSGEHDPDNTVVAITQTGGQCRATNYLAQIKSGIKNAGFPDIPIVILSTGTVYQNAQKPFKLPVLKLVNVTVYALLYADAVQQMYSSTVVREKIKGSAKQLFDRFIDEGVEATRRNSPKKLLELLKEAIERFNGVEIHEDREYTKIGLIGEIFLKYNDYGQAHITEWLQSQGLEVITPPILDFIMQYFVNSEVNAQHGLTRGSILKYYLNPVLKRYMATRISKVEQIFKSYRFYQPSRSIFEKAGLASEIIDLSNQFGEGWMIAAETACFAHDGVNRVVCVQPFGCIANHVIAKGIEKRIKKFYPQMNLLYLDIDGGIADVNLQNRLHFLIN